MKIINKRHMRNLVENIRNSLISDINLEQYQDELRSLVGNDLYKVVYPSVLSTIKLMDSIEKSKI